VNIPRYWAKETYSMAGPDGKTVSAVCWHGSNVSVDDARQPARARAQQIAWKILNKQRLDRYGYGERALREEITQAVTNAHNKELGLITRNGYGALVLNAISAMFIDIDFKEEKSSGVLGKLFSKPGPTQEEQSVARVEQWARRNPGLSVRIYRTFGGLRCLVTSDVFDPSHESTSASPAPMLSSISRTEPWPALAPRVWEHPICAAACLHASTLARCAPKFCLVVIGLFSTCATCSPRHAQAPQPRRP